MTKRETERQLFRVQLDLHHLMVNLDYLKQQIQRTHTIITRLLRLSEEEGK